jgi:glycogen phosphorylase
MRHPEPLATQLHGVELLSELALELRASWDHSTDDLWRRIDPELWELTRNPWVVLQSASEAKLKELAADTVFRRRVEDLVLARRGYESSPAWFQREHRQAPLAGVAYFSMEFGLSEALPIYSGGLGNVAGDQLKAASDLGVPITGVGLLYQQGYFRQVIDAHGQQIELFPYNSPIQLPIAPLRDAEGELVRLEFTFPGYKVWVRAWQAKVGRVRLYLLDSNDPANPPAIRGITSELYGGGPELRLQQEILLGIGGWRLLRRLGIKPDVCHLNEGHAAFAVLERARDFMEASGQPFDAALAVTRAGNLFTTHTPVAAGFDHFDPELIRIYLEARATNILRISLHDLLALGRLDPADNHEPFNMAYLAMRGSAAVNGVSKLHGEVSRRIFAPLFPRWPISEVPIGHVTNGVHTPSWDSTYADRLWTDTAGPERWLDKMESTGDSIRKVSDELLWGLRTSNRRELVNYTRERLTRQVAANGGTDEEISTASNVFDPNALTLGFARRFATYKRPALLLHDPERLARILNNPRFPVQIAIAGKAHPADSAGKALIHQWIEFVRRSDIRPHAVFLSDYDLHVAERMVQGVDVWINNPRRPWEASGTSGMKVLVNGGLNLSELDGWWAEAYAPEVGWAIGDGLEHGDDPAWDAAEAEQLYRCLEQEVVPMFYERDAQGLPRAWIAKMRESMARLTPEFSANRTVREYTEKYYLPAAAAYRKREGDAGAVGVQVRNWQLTVATHWSRLRLGDLRVETESSEHVFSLQVYLDEIDPDSVRVELFVQGSNGDQPQVIPMLRDKPLIGAVNGFNYVARVPASRPTADYTPRLVPYHPDARIPLEANEILWQR